MDLRLHLRLHFGRQLQPRNVKTAGPGEKKNSWRFSPRGGPPATYETGESAEVAFEVAYLGSI